MADYELLESLEAAADNQPMGLWSEGRFIDWLRDTVIEILKNAAANLDPDDVVETAQLFYEKRIRPLDLPYVPNSIEPMVDDAIWQACEYAIRRGLANLGD